MRHALLSTPLGTVARFVLWNLPFIGLLVAVSFVVSRPKELLVVDLIVMAANIVGYYHGYYLGLKWVPHVDAPTRQPSSSESLL